MNNNNMYNMQQGYGQHHNAMQQQQQQPQQQQQHNIMGDYMSQNYPDPSDFGNVATNDFGNSGVMRQDFSLDDLNFDPAYIMDNNCTDDLAVRSTTLCLKLSK